MGEVAPTEEKGEIEGRDGKLLQGRNLDGAGDKVMFIEGNVYDVSDFMQVHPGGKLVMERLLGRDATEGFRKVGHSSSAREKLAQLLVLGKTPSDYRTPSPQGLGATGAIGDKGHAVAIRRGLPPPLGVD